MVKYLDIEQGLYWYRDLFPCTILAWTYACPTGFQAVENLKIYRKIYWKIVCLGSDVLFSRFSHGKISWYRAGITLKSTPTSLYKPCMNLWMSKWISSRLNVKIYWKIYWKIVCLRGQVLFSRFSHGKISWYRAGIAWNPHLLQLLQSIEKPYVWAVMCFFPGFNMVKYLDIEQQLPWYPHLLPCTSLAWTYACQKGFQPV